jgi:chromosomal replication initiation ATPase DnaA
MVSVDRHRGAIETTRAFAADQLGETRLLLVLGSAGVGKTALVQQLISDLSARGTRRCHIMSARDVVGRMVEAIRSNTFNELARQFSRSDFVVLEDVSDLCGRQATLAELGRLIAGWLGRGAHAVCTVGCSLQTIKDFEQRLPPPPVSRVVALPKPTRHEMRAILRSLAAAAVVRIDRASLADLAVWCDGDIRRAVGAIRQIQFEEMYVTPRR